jgi:hypothetical protein
MRVSQARVLLPRQAFGVAYASPRCTPSAIGRARLDGDARTCQQRGPRQLRRARQLAEYHGREQRGGEGLGQ